MEERSPNDIDLITAVDTEEKAIKGEMQYGHQTNQVMGITKYKYKDDDYKIIEQSYSEYFDNNPFMKEVDLVHIKSTTYENVNITKNND